MRRQKGDREKKIEEENVEEKEKVKEENKVEEEEGVNRGQGGKRGGFGTRSQRIWRKELRSIIRSTNGDHHWDILLSISCFLLKQAEKINHLVQCKE